jgi:hypothetical protein
MPSSVSIFTRKTFRHTDQAGYGLMAVIFMGYLPEKRGPNNGNIVVCSPVEASKSDWAEMALNRGWKEGNRRRRGHPAMPDSWMSRMTEELTRD